MLSCTVTAKVLLVAKACVCIPIFFRNFTRRVRLLLAAHTIMNPEGRIIVERIPNEESLFDMGRREISKILGKPTSTYEQ